MRKLIKYLLIIIATLIVVFFLYLNTIFKTTAENIASRMTGTKVSISFAAISPFSGTIVIKGMDVGNPKGFQSKHAIEFSSLTANVDTKTIFDEKIRITKVELKNPVIYYEVGMDGDNIRKLLSNVKSNSASPARAEAANESSKRIKRKVVIDDLYLINCKARLAANFFGLKAGHEVKLDNIHLKNIGESKGGVSVENVTGLVLQNIIKQLASIRASDITDQIGGIDTKSISKSLGGIKDLF
jgi:hypothetical protein